MQTIADRLLYTQNLIAQATKNAHRPANSVKLLAVSKTKPVSDLELAYAAGQRLFGENYVQEGVEKIKKMQSLRDIEWHFIGPLQSNKTRLVAEHFDWMQSVDRAKIAQRLNDQRPVNLPPLQVCIQINIDDEASKSGVAVAEIDTLAAHIATLPNLCLRGIMAIPRADADKEAQKNALAAMQSIFTDLKARYSTIDTLSIGMSNDMTLAIENGSTMVRIGTAIFGARK
ncbi:YggS family pyridoxal phosphate-dependent enzyme [Alteromonas sp. ASW11-36]|uniref:Pyridoxal phosphate homeostasis protein n=1 Tax=Alteromonas arenosi TaxID=3055817 RepID=A0ABT7SVC5_9ALTE|nr:YggS family pyridoxal phosphate-dependent enzyme [Alteromonas sp. ASW11-36]MDM7859499.1 YggS family pyridoxal phosphate-dependent enzyme [Alteromonas sp. ASW11-36]